MTNTLVNNPKRWRWSADGNSQSKSIPSKPCWRQNVITFLLNVSLEILFNKTKFNKNNVYLDDSDPTNESNSPAFPHPPHEINIFKSGFSFFNFIIRG